MSRAVILEPPHRWISAGAGVHTELLAPEGVDAACDRLRDGLAGWEMPPLHDGGPWQVVPLQVSTKAQVFVVRARGAAAVVKLHRDEESYLRELFALTLLGEERACPELLACRDEERALVMELLERELIVDGVDALCRAARHLGRIHACGDGNQDVLDSLDGDCSLRQLHDVEARDFADPAAFRLVVSIQMDRHGPDHVPVTVNDFKRGHARVRDDGSLAFVDLETLTTSLPAPYDLLSLLNLHATRPELSPADWRRVLDAYLGGRGARHTSEDVESELGCVWLAARSLGFEELVARP